MMIGPLYKRMLSMQAKSIIGFSAGSILYLWMIIGVYPSLAKSSSINDLLAQMPDTLLKAFNISGSYGDLSHFMSNEYYGLLYLIILSFFSITLTAALISGLSDSGAMVYLLSGPFSRFRIAITQYAVFLTALAAINALIFAGGLLGVRLFTEASLQTAVFFKLNMMGFLLFFAFGSMGFLFSCLFSEHRKTLGLGAAVVLVEYLLNLAGKLNDHWEWMKSFSLFTLFRPAEILEKKHDLLLNGFVLTGIGILLAVIGIIGFNRRNLSI